MKLAGCKPFCTGCCSFLPQLYLRCKHLQMLVAVPSAEATLQDVLHAISRDTAWPAIQQCLPCVLYLEMRFLLQGLILCKALKCMLKCSSAPSQEEPGMLIRTDSWWHEGKQHSTRVMPCFSCKKPRTQNCLAEEMGVFTNCATFSAI